ncbi:MAG: TetR/AcrR family transcriptional regulator C-terminal domain-containing protein [Mycobacterium sp.]|nr:TetR/AcrR family transcriptional regulator C-terminal domain-containing protein [Mycobacterium sp.]
MTRRRPLSRSEIVRCALDLAERDGLEKLSLHKIAAAVGVKTMSLYNHVADKSDVLDAMSDQILAEMDIPDVDALTWENGIFELSSAFRAAAIRYPQSAPLVLVRRLNAPSVLPVVDAALRTLHRAGLDPAAAVHALRTLIAFLVGSLLRETGTGFAMSMTATTVIATPEAHLLAVGLPSVAESAAELAVCDHDAEFRFGLGLFVESLRARIPTHHVTQRSRS